MAIVCLAKVSPLNPATGSRVDLYLSSAQDRSVTGLNGVVWEPAMTASPTLSINLWQGDFREPVDTGGASFSINMGILKMTYAGCDAYNWAGAPVEIYAEEPGTAWPWATRFKGRVASYSRRNDVLTINATIETEAFDKNILTTTYAGTGGAEGGADLKGRLKPLVIGWAQNVEPILIDTVNNVYQFSGYGAIEAVSVLYERAASFGASIGDYATYAALVAAAIPAGRWGTCLASGMVRLGAPAAGVITGDVRGHRVGSTTPRLTGAVISALATIAGVSTANIETSTLTSLDTAVPYPINLVLTEQIEWRDMAAQLALACNWQSGITLPGKFFVLSVSLSGSEVITLNAQGTALPQVTSSDEQDVSVPYYLTIFGANRCWRVHTADEIAFTAALVERGTYSATETYREGNIVTTADGSRWLYINATASSGNAPPTPPTLSDSYWSNLTLGSAGAVITGYLTNESHTVAADASGTVSSFSGSGGTFVVTQDGATVTSGVTYSVASSTDVTISIDTAGVYTITAMAAATGYATLRAVYGTVTIDKVYSIAKAVSGATGTSNAVVTVFKRAATTPTAPSGTLTYTFSTSLLSGTGIDGWSQTVPTSDGNPLWSVSAPVASSTGTDTIAPGEWSAPAIVAANGSDALDVTLSNAMIVLPVDGSGAVTSYAIATGTLRVRTPSGTDVSSNFSLSTNSNPQALTVAYASQTYTISGGFDAGEASATLVINITGSGPYAGFAYVRTVTLSKAVANTNVSNDRNGAAVVAPTTPTGGLALEHTTNPDSTVNITFAWNWGGSEVDIDGFEIIVRSSTSSTAYTIGTTVAEEQVYSVPPNKRVIVLDGLPAQRYYTFYVRAYRIVDTDINATGILRSTAVKSTVAGENPYQPAATTNFTGNINGTPAGDVSTAVTNFNARNDRLSTAIAAPTFALDGSAIDHTVNTDSSCDISFEWVWSGTEADIDQFEIVVVGRSNPATYIIGADPTIEQRYYVRPDKRAFILQGVAADIYWTFYVRAIRVVDPDVNATGIIASAWARPDNLAHNVNLWRRSATAPALPTGTFTYTFATGALSGGTLNGWTQTIPADDGNPLYTIAATAFGSGTTDTIPIAEFSPSLAVGTSVIKQRSIFLYQRSATVPTVPSTALSYNFLLDSLTGTLGSWTRTIPAGSNTLYVICATVCDTGNVASIPATEWSSPVVSSGSLAGTNENPYQAIPGIAYRGDISNTVGYAPLTQQSVTVVPVYRSTTGALIGSRTKIIKLNRYKGTADVSSSSTWSVTAYGMTPTVDANGLVTVNPAGSIDAFAVVTSTYEGIPMNHVVAAESIFTTVFAVAGRTITTGPAVSVSALTSTTEVDVSSVFVGRTGPTGAVSITAFVGFVQDAAGTPAGVTLRLYRRPIGGSYTLVATVTSTPQAYEEIYSRVVLGGIVGAAQTGLTANTEYEFVFRALRGTAGAPAASIIPKACWIESY